MYMYMYVYVYYIYILPDPCSSMTYICFDLSHIVDYSEEIDERMESRWIHR